MKDEFLEFVKKLMDHDPDYTNSIKTDNAVLQKRTL